MFKMAIAISVAALALLPTSTIAQQFNLPNALCGPPVDVIAAVEGRGFVNEPIFNVLIPRQIADRGDYALLAYMLGSEEIAARASDGGYVTQRILWILRTDRDPESPDGWACIYQEIPIVLDQNREEAFQRASDVQEIMSHYHSTTD